MKTLYLGLDPARWKTKNTLVHYPVIETRKLFSKKRKQALKKWEEFTHVIYTSPRTVQYMKEEGLLLEGKQAIAIGEGTKEALQKQNIEPLVAPRSCQEGVIELLERLDLSRGYVLLPHSKKARPNLKSWLLSQKLRFFSFALYDTLNICPRPIPDLSGFSEIVFTSPSTVKSFFKIYPKLPERCKITCIGLVTTKYLYSL